jgi:hypothetical protein
VNRRSFFGFLAGGVAAAAAVDVDRLLWVPGKKVYSIPRDFSGDPYLAIRQFSAKYIDPTVIRIANCIDQEVFTRYLHEYNVKDATWSTRMDVLWGFVPTKNHNPAQEFLFGDKVHRPFHPDTYRIFAEGRHPNLQMAEIDRQYRSGRLSTHSAWIET